MRIEPSIIAQAWPWDSQVNCQRWLVQVEAIAPRTAALGIVLDLSDSCPPIRELLDRLPQLLKKLRRDTPVWFYCLSNNQILDTESKRCGDWVDGTFGPDKWLDDATFIKRMAMRGSLLRPVLEAVADRKHSEAIESVSLLVLTDGGLSDSARLMVPPGIKVFGLLPNARCRDSRWRQVLPSCSLCELEETDIDRAFAEEARDYFGACEIDIKCDETPIEISVLDFHTRQIRPCTHHQARCNLAEQSLSFILELPAAATTLPQIAIRSLRTGNQCELRILQNSFRPDEHTVTQITQLLDSAAECAWHILVDSREADASFKDDYHKFMIAKRLCESQEPWLTAAGNLTVWQADSWSAIRAGNAEDRFDALICIAQNGLSAEVVRIVLIGLRKQCQPAFQWEQFALKNADFQTAAFDVFFDHLENRWILRENQKFTRELNPIGSQLITTKAAPDVDMNCTVLFSGSIS